MSNFIKLSAEETQLVVKADPAIYEAYSAAMVAARKLPENKMWQKMRELHPEIDGIHFWQFGITEDGCIIATYQKDSR